MRLVSGGMRSGWGAQVRCVSVVCAWGVAAAVLASGAGHAAAQTAALEAPIADPATDPLSGGRPHHVFLFAGFDIWRFGSAGYGGLQWAAQGLDNDGFIARLFMSQGRERFLSPSQTFSTDIFRASLLPGFRFKRGDVEVKLFAGLDLETRRLTPDVRSAALRGTHVGARLAAELWWEPTAQTMLSASAYVTSVGSGVGARAAAGWRVFERAWLGPEWQGSRDPFSSQMRYGAHLTGLRTAELEWSAAAGYVTDSYKRDGIYGRIGVLLRQ